MKVRDKLWLFASRAHDDDIWLGKSSSGFTKWSRITPAEGALMLDVPNIIMIGSDGVPAPYSAEAYGYMESFCRMKNVVWSISGSAGFRAGNEEKFICDLAEKYPNVTGAFADDFLVEAPDAERSAAQLETVRQIRRQLDLSPRHLSMWLTMYTRNIASADRDTCELFDNLSLWTWSYRDLDMLAENFSAWEERFPNQKKYLGVYIYDYPSGQAIPDEYMEKQCSFGLSMMKEGRAEGIIFLTNCVMGVGLSSEYWLRKWIDSVKDTDI